MDEQQTAPDESQRWSWSTSFGVPLAAALIAPSSALALLGVLDDPWLTLSLFALVSFVAGVLAVVASRRKRWRNSFVGIVVATLMIIPAIVPFSLNPFASSFEP